MKNFIILFCLLAFLSIEAQTDTNTDCTKVYLIRHAEKDRSDSTNKNPSLTIQGLERANKWALFFKDKNIAAVYSTNYKRTQQTALPIAKEQNLEIISYTAKELISEKFIAYNKGKNIIKEKPFIKRRISFEERKK